MGFKEGLKNTADKLSSLETGEKLTLILTFVAALVFTPLIFPDNSEPSFDPLLSIPPEKGNFSAEYNESAEELYITLTEGKLTRESGYLGVKQLSNNSRKLNMYGYGKEKKTNYWADKSFFTLGLFHRGLKSFPVNEGETITISNVESDQTYAVYSKDEDSDASLTYVKIWNNSAAAAKVWNTRKYVETWGYESIPISIRKDLERNNISVD